MKLIIRRKNSQRASAPIPVSFYPNYSGQGGLPLLILESDQTYYTLEPETLDEVRQVMSQVHILHHNFPANDGKRDKGEER
ncbi:hypothetical protein M0Q28_06105 [Patescibacteria group bacterium]|jgi:hypothetical protein|nr:hypothetical protein [Patescibacteria group bacterium]